MELQAVHLAEQVLVPLQRGIVDGKHARQSAPFGRHIANREALIDRQGPDAIARKLDRGIQHLVVLKVATKRHDHVLACHARRQCPSELDLDHRGELPPRLARGPNRRGIRAYDRRAHRTYAAVHVGVTVGRDTQRLGKGVSLFHEHLVPNTAARGVKVDVLLPRESFDARVLVEVFGALVLYVVVQGKHDLSRIVNPLSSDRMELGDHRTRVVVRHDRGWANRHVVAGAHWHRRVPVDRILLHDLFNVRLVGGGIAHLR